MEESPVVDKKLAQKLAEEKLLIQMRKDELAREKALDEISLSKIKEKWYNTFLNIRIPEMQDNLRHILHYMEKLIEVDNFRKIIMENERDEMSKQSTLVAQSHNLALERLCDIYETRVKEIREALKEKALERKQQAEEEFSLIDKQEQLYEENFRTMLYQMEQNKNQEEYTISCNMFFKLDDERSKNTEKLENLRSKLEKKMETRWSEINSTLMQYEKNTQHRRTHYLRLKAKDDADMKIIHQQMKKTQKLFEQFEKLKECRDNCYASPEKLAKITDLQEERHKLYTSFMSLKELVAQESELDQKKLTLLTALSKATTDELRRLLKKGEEILTLYRICLKFETQSEKVFPVGGFSSNKQTQETTENKKQHEERLQDREKGEWPADYDVLSTFWKKVGKARLSSLALKKCIKNMKEENEVLKETLVKYLKNIASKN